MEIDFELSLIVLFCKYDLIEFKSDVIGSFSYK